MTDGNHTGSTRWSWRRRIRMASALLVAALAIESALSWSYVAKRVISRQPYPDLLVQYYVLEPFARLFPDQFVFPANLWHMYAGDLENPRAAARWWVADPLLGHRNATNTLVTENRWSYRQTNSQGFVITEPSSPTYLTLPNPDVFRIVVLGGSTVEGNGASGPLKALPGALVEALKSYEPPGGPHKRFEIINAGVSGYFSTTELLYYVSKLRHFQPHLVISYNGWNDLQLQNRALEQEGIAAPYLWNTETRQFETILNGYYRWDATARNFAQRSLRGIAARARGMAIFDMPIRAALKVFSARKGKIKRDQEAVYFYDPVSVNRYIENIAHLNWALQRDRSGHAWFMQPLAGVGNHPPATGYLGFDELAYQTTNANRIARRKAVYSGARKKMESLERGNETICAKDLSRVFDQTPEPVYDDPGHLNDHGNAVVAAAIARHLEECGLIRSR